MNVSAAIPTFLITLREGVEAALVIGIVLATLHKANQRQFDRWIYGGIVAGLVGSALIGAGFHWGLAVLESARQSDARIIKPMLEAILNILAIALLSWMLIWMTRQARTLKSQVETAVRDSLQTEDRPAWGLFGLVFATVLREGFETVLFIAAQFQAGLLPTVGAISGIFSAAGIGVLLFRWGVKINLRVFFQVMGILLLLIVSGLVVSALKYLNVAADTLTQLHPSLNLCITQSLSTSASCILGPLAWDTSAKLPDQQFPGIVLKTLLGYRDHLYWAQAVSYGLFWLTIGNLYIRSLGSTSASSPSPSSRSTSGVPQ
jgi:high-affinity iron transporter